jgi:hypothetical protein
MKNISKTTKAGRVCACALVLILSCAALTAAFPVEDDAESSLCKAAFSRCMAEAIFSGLFSAGGTLFFYVSFCLIGWDFCQKYVQA